METSPLLLLLLLLCAGGCSKVLLSDGPDGHLRRLHLSEKVVSWKEAQELCRESFTDLMTIHSDEEAEALGKILKVNQVWVFPWIGLLYNTAARQRWSDGRPVEFQVWSNATDGCNATCAAVSAGQVTWDDCATRRAFLCLKDVVSGSPAEYVLIKQEKSWSEARCYCRQRFSDLASALTQDQYDQVLRFDSARPFWIGLQSDHWAWSDGGLSTYRRDWVVEGCPAKSDDCVYFKTLHNSTELNYSPCRTTKRALCYQDVVVELVRERRTWEEALNNCSVGGGRMLTIETLDDQRVVEQALKEACLAGTAWLGLRQSRLFGFWFWTSDAVVEGWSQWAGGRSPEMPWSEHCAVIDAAEGYAWRDRGCLSKHYFLCERNFTGPAARVRERSITCN